MSRLALDLKKGILVSEIVSIIFVSFVLLTRLSWAATYYIRTDGGTADQCSGTVDAPYPGSGTNQSCGWAHPFWALDSNGNWKIQGGDTLLIYSGSYQMGFGSPNTGWCSTESTWDCYLPPLPSGTSPQNPTKLLGVGWNSGCANPPELWGTQRANYILTLNGTSNAVIDCLEITDHSGCVESHPNPSVACQRDTYPYGDWALIGIYAADSSNVTLRHLNIHGLAHTGIRAGRLSDWTVEDVRIAGNGMAGWDGDLQEGVNLNSNHGTLTFWRLTVEWSGCAESYPGGQQNNCWGQSVGGYGDGFGQGGLTGGHWIIEDSVFRYNTQDGIDMLYVRENNSQIEIRRTQSYGNAGDQMKVNGPTRIENSLMVSNCGYFNGKSFTYNVGDCRAGGSALVFSMRRGSRVSVVNSTLVGQGDCLLIVQCDSEAVPPCDGSEVPIIQNNIFQGYQEFGTDDMTCDVWFDRDNFYQTQEDYNVIHPDTKLGEFQHGSHDIFQDPLFVNANLETFDGHLQAGSPAIDSGLPVGSLNGLIPSDDLTGAPRPYGSGVDRGAYEYGTTPLPSPSNRCDFNGDGKTDILWRNKSTGQNIVWLMNGTIYSSYTELLQVADTNWQIVGTGDFNGDGKTDILWRNKSTGQNVVWFMNGATLSSYSWIDTVADTNWQIVGTGDFNGDGKTDILWRNKSTGQDVVWYMNGAAFSSYSWIDTVADTNWQIVGTGDFNGDGKTDILWRNKSTGQNVVWYMNGATYSSYAEILQVADTNWQIVGTGDFNGDGKTDILWRNKSTGQNVVWLMNGTTYGSYTWLIDVPDTNWEIVAPK